MNSRLIYLKSSFDDVFNLLLKIFHINKQRDSDSLETLKDLTSNRQSFMCAKYGLLILLYD